MGAGHLDCRDVNRYDVLPDGTLRNGKLLIDLSKETERGVTDGMRVDTKGNLYETGPGGVWIISPEGKHLGTIRAPEQATNVGFAISTKRRCTSPRAPASTESG